MNSDMECSGCGSEIEGSFDGSDLSDECDDDSGGDCGEKLLCSLAQMNRKLRLACRQVVLMNNEMGCLRNRYDGAVDCSGRDLSCFLRLKIATVEGIRNMFYFYESQHADGVDALHVGLLGEGVIGEGLDLEALDDEEEECLL